MKLKDLLKLKTEETPLDLTFTAIDTSLDLNETTLEWYRRKIQEWLIDKMDCEICISQRKAIDMFKDRRFTLRKQVTYKGMLWKVGSIGFTLDSICLGVFPKRARSLLEDNIKAHHGVQLCALGEHVYTLPLDYLRFKKEENQNQEMFL